MHYVTIWMPKGHYIVDEDVSPEEARQIAIDFHRSRDDIRFHATCVDGMVSPPLRVWSTWGNAIKIRSGK